MNLKEIKEIINLMNENELAEVELETEGTKIKLKKTSSGVTQVVHAAPVVHGASAPIVSSVPSQSAPVETTSGNNGKKREEIKSPMVGTFYRAPSPEAAPFVAVGQVVEPGQVLCIIEAMKLMNEIKSEIKGKIVDIKVENAQPVEFGQTLFVVEPV
ncbi:MAG TPA: acetyl-CoA carboxylase biotin carboxyl carrier protein [Candidatus Omnitrophota bacterium]|nr:acetyl-CoA carboxylase biotin carboxyl carrier protein [Candidatus Omnitrophota bacterium]HPN88146.1 acetyl-CoA carboxylase biotin carboxyl carrier protein [Candidatus Omnitrophota bacterium]